MISNSRTIGPRSPNPGLPVSLTERGVRGVHTYRTGREALIALIDGLQLSGRDVLLPGHLPQGIHAPFSRRGCVLHHYDLDEFGNADIEHFAALLNRTDPGLVVFIHYFGVLRNASEVQALLRPRGIPLLEDLAHTYFVDDSPIGRIGDYALFSLPKMVGVPDGGVLVRRGDQSSQAPVAPGRFHPRASLYSSMIGGSLAVQSATVAGHLPQGAGKLAALLSVGGYQLLMRYFEHPSPMSSAARRLWEFTDHDAVVSRRRSHARRYLDGLRPACAAVCPDPGIDAQRDVLMGFPLSVQDGARTELEAHLVAAGIRALKFVGKWGFLPPEQLAAFSGTAAFRERHLLLPINHRLDSRSIDSVIDAVNRFG